MSDMLLMIFLGDIDDIVMQVIPQTQFTPLPDALCLIISDLERWGILASFPEIQLRLCEVYRGMHQPPDDLIHETLAKLMKEGKVFQRGTTGRNLLIRFIMTMTMKLFLFPLKHLHIHIYNDKQWKYGKVKKSWTYISNIMIK